jgi:hypothetical protein
MDIEICGRCGGFVRVIACIEDQDIIDRILAHLRDKEPATPSLPFPTATDTTAQGATWHIASFRWEGTRFSTVRSARTPLKTSRPEPLHAVVQEWTDMNGFFTDAGKISGR